MADLTISRIIHTSCVICVGWLILGVNCLSLNRDVPCDTNIYLEVGKQGTVPCRFQNFELVGWIIAGGNYEETTPFIYMENSEEKGRGYDSGDYNMLQDGSLIINTVKLEHEYNFIIVYLPADGAQVYYQVPVRVFVRPDPDYPVVNGLINQQFIVIEVDFYSGSINCSMNGVRPKVELEWVYQSDVISMENEPFSISNNTDGTYNISLSSGFTIRHTSVGKITLQCRVVGEMADLFPSVTTIYLLKLNKYFPVINGEANQQHLVLQLNREDVMTCALDRVLQGVSLEWVILSAKDEVTLDSEISTINNGDGTFNITLRSKFIEIGPSVHHVVLQCGVSGPAGDMYPYVTTVEVLLSENFPAVNGQARQHHSVLYLKRQDELNCSINGVSEDISLEWIIINSGLGSDIIFKNDVSRAKNGDGTSNVTLTSCFSVMSSSVQHVTLQCRVSGQGANLYPDVTTVEILFSEILPSPVIDGCYSQQEDCTLMMLRDEILTCYVPNIPSEFIMNLSLAVFAGNGGLSLTRIKYDLHPHVSGNYDLTTSYQYTVDEAFTLSVIQCSLLGMKNNQPLNSTVTALIVWQGTTSDGIPTSILFIIILIFIIQLIILIVLIITSFKKYVKITSIWKVHVPENQTDMTMEVRNDEGTPESQALLIQDRQTQTTEATDVKGLYTTIISLLENIHNSTDAGSSSHSSDSAIVQLQ